MTEILFQNVTKRYPGNILAVDRFQMEIPNKEFVVLVGPSGCGKSTLLRMVAGLEEITEGELFLGGRVVNQVEPKDRNVAMVFQNYALYPHMTIYNNIAFSMKMKRMPRKEIDMRVRQVARLLEIEDVLFRKPRALSGGQRQRVALGRAMVREPNVFLLDEPLSNLDAKLRTSMRREIVELYQRLDSTFLYVTHDQTEAMTMGTRIVVMDHGVVKQADTPDRLYHAPKNRFVAEFIGSPQMNMLDASLSGGTVLVEGEQWRLPQEMADRLSKKEGLDPDQILLGIRPEYFRLASGQEEALTLCGEVQMVENLGSDANVYFKTVSGNRLCAKAPGSFYGKIGDRISFSVQTKKVHLFDQATGNAL